MMWVSCKIWRGGILGNQAFGSDGNTQVHRIRRRKYTDGCFGQNWLQTDHETSKLQMTTDPWHRQKQTSDVHWPPIKRTGKIPVIVFEPNWGLQLHCSVFPSEFRQPLAAYLDLQLARPQSKTFLISRKYSTFENKEGENLFLTIPAWRPVFEV